MGWRFRKSFCPIPGVRVTLSPRGLSTSVGVGPLRLSAGPSGAAFTANLPGTGLSYRQPLGGGAQTGRSLQQPLGGSPHQPSFSAPSPQVVPNNYQPTLTPELSDIKSAGTGSLTTPGLSEYKRLLTQALREYSEIANELVSIRRKEAVDAEKCRSWTKGWFMRHLFKAKFQEIQITAQESAAQRIELEEQEAQSRLQTQMEIPDGVQRAFHRMCDDFSLMASSKRVWDTVGQRSTNRVAERTTAARVVDRRSVSFRMGNSEVIASDWQVPHLENANGGDLFFYPAFVLYFISTETFALLEYKDVQLLGTSTRFIEEEAVPQDSVTVGHTWAKANKDGSPDKRFNGNYQIPIAQYGKLTITSHSGLNEEYMVSNVERTEEFAKAWRDFSIAVNAGV